LIQLVVNPVQETLLPDAPGLIIFGVWPVAGQLFSLASIQGLPTRLKIHAVVLG
tara:strand:- start:595 stop:756 length:162 start_codon:yes stop_codon:yes gene_type:complete